MVNKNHRRNINEPRHAHELTFSCYQGYPFLKSEQTCHWLADSLNEARHEQDFLLWAYVFMPNHVHLVIFPTKLTYDIATIRKSIKSPVAAKAIRYLEQHSSKWIDRITRQRGQKTERLFWQSGGGYDRNITEGNTLLKMILYIHENPVRAGLVERGKDWHWSSAGWYADRSETPLAVDPIPVDWLQSRDKSPE